MKQIPDNVESDHYIEATSENKSTFACYEMVGEEMERKCKIMRNCLEIVLLHSLDINLCKL